jgi:hypothetical protein
MPHIERWLCDIRIEPIAAESCLPTSEPSVRDL